MSPGPQRRALARLLADKGPTLYALYDAAQDGDLLREMRRDGIAHECLYSGTKAVTLSNVAPYLIACEQFSDNADRFIDIIWNRGVSMLVESASVPEMVKMQLKKNAFVKNSVGEDCYFRYYDTRAFSRFARVATNAQLSQLFGEAVSSIVWHDTIKEGLLGLSRKRIGLFDRILDPSIAEFDFHTLTG